MIKTKASRIILLLILSASAVSANADTQQWLLVSGKWSIDTQNKALSDAVARSRFSGYNEIFNMNSVSSLTIIEKPTRIQASFELFAPMEGNKGMVFFASPSQKTFHALRITGTSERITAVTLIKSDVRDSTLPATAKGNYIVSELTSAPVSIKWGDTISIDIALNKKKIKATVNGTSLEYALSDSLPAGKIGFSHANNLIKIRSVCVWSEKKEVFKDDFSSQTIKTMSVNAKKVENSK